MLVLIDGHNLIARLADIDLGDANDEDRLLVKLRQYRAKTGRRIIVLFDAGAAYQLASKRTEGGITIQYAPHGRPADQLIIKHLRRAANPQQILVVTSDRAIQQVARQVKAQVISAADFETELAPRLTESEPNHDVNLTDEEVAEWLALFNHGRKKDGSDPKRRK